MITRRHGAQSAVVALAAAGWAALSCTSMLGEGTGEELPRRLEASAFGDEAIAAYRKFLTGQPLVEKAVSVDRPEFRIQAKMRGVRAGIERWHSSGRDPSAVGQLMEGAQSLFPLLSPAPNCILTASRR